MTVSIVIPAYNSEKTIGECLLSLLNQSIKDKEIIVVDDESTDNTARIVKQFNQVKYLYQKRAGPAKARNLGIKNANGAIIAFIDSDCIAAENWLEQMLASFNDERVMGVQGAYKSNQKEFIAKFVQLEIEERYKFLKKAKNLDWAGSYSAAYRKKALREVNYFDESFPKASGEDPELSFKLQEHGYSLVFNPNAIVWHKHPSKLIDYLKTKFSHAFYRVNLYSKHKQKIIKDSYTPQVLKLQIILFYLLLITLAGAIAVPELITLAALSLVLFFVTTIPFALFALKKNISIGVASPFIIFLRSAVFGFGLIFGSINKVIK